MKNTRDTFRVGILGLGTVGRAVAYGLEFIADIKIYDKYCPVDDFQTVMDESEFIFVCVPTPSKPSHGIDLFEVDEIMAKIARVTDGKDKIIILKSTVVPGTAGQYQLQYPHLNIVVNPEFLSERTALLDFINPNRIILGGDKHVCEKVAKLYRERLPHVPMYITTPETAEMAKYVSNTFFATKIGFFNEICLFCQKLGIDYDEVKKMVMADGRVGNSHMDVPGHDGKLGWGGGCFSKDAQAFCQKAKEMSVDLKILKAAIKSNQEIRRES